MNALELKKHLHDQIENLDEQSLEAMYAILQDYLGNRKAFELTDVHKDIINERLEDYEKNPQNVISWAESRQSIHLISVCNAFAQQE